MKVFKVTYTRSMSPRARKSSLRYCVICAADSDHAGELVESMARSDGRKARVLLVSPWGEIPGHDIKRPGKRDSPAFRFPT